MKKTISFLCLLFAASLCHAQWLSDISSGPVSLTSTCSNANSTCDTAGTTNFIPNSPFNVQGPQTLEMTTQGYGLVQVTFSGTYTGATENFEISDDGGTTWYSTTCTRIDTNVQEVSEAIATNAFRGIECAVGAATKFRVRQSAISTGGPIVKATLTSGLVEPAPTVQIAQAGVSGANACLNPHSNLQTAFVSMSTTALTQFIAASAGTRIYVCSAIFTNSTATNPVQLEYGTGSNCGTGTTVAVDKFTAPASTASPVILTGPVFVTPASQALCYIQSGTTPTASMAITYVQQ